MQRPWNGPKDTGFESRGQKEVVGNEIRKVGKSQFMSGPCRPGQSIIIIAMIDCKPGTDRI